MTIFSVNFYLQIFHYCSCLADIGALVSFDFMALWPKFYSYSYSYCRLECPLCDISML